VLLPPFALFRTEDQSVRGYFKTNPVFKEVSFRRIYPLSSRLSALGEPIGLHRNSTGCNRQKVFVSTTRRNPVDTTLMERGEKIDLVLFRVIPAKAGIQCFQEFTNCLDPGFHRGDG
jgi:hypothetical protein